MSRDRSEDSVPQGTEFDFEAWALESKLSKKTCTLLKKEELTVPEAIEALNKDDIACLGLPLGQAKLLTKAVNRFQQTEQEQAGPPEDITIDAIRKQVTELDHAGNFLDSLPENISTPNLPARDKIIVNADNPLQRATTATSTSPHDPRTVLTLRASSTKAVHITSFLTEKAKTRLKSKDRHYVLSECEEPNMDKTQMLIHSSPDKHPYLGITIAEWGAANSRVMHHLIKIGALQLHDIDFYLAYTAIVFDFASQYEWSSVLEFDYRYREQQAEHGFQWGHINPLMELQILVKKSQPKLSAPTSKTNAAVARTREDCRQWRRFNGYCPFGDACRYNHPQLPDKPNHTSSNDNKAGKK